MLQFRLGGGGGGGVGLNTLLFLQIASVLCGHLKLQFYCDLFLLKDSFWCLVSMFERPKYLAGYFNDSLGK